MSGARRSGVLTALIADDEALARHRLVELLDRREGIRIVGQCATGSATIEAVRELRPDVLFLDVQMPDLNGFEVLGRLAPDETPIVVFSTAYDEYALAAFEVHAVDYLLKPFSDERFDESLQRAERTRLSDRLADLDGRLRRLLDQFAPPDADAGAPAADSARTPYLERFAVRSGDRLMVVEAHSVEWIEAAGDYVSLHVGGRTHLVRATMAALERRLDPRRFLRIHRSTIARLDRIRTLHTNADGSYAAALEGGVRLRVSRRYRDAVLARVGLRL